MRIIKLAALAAVIGLTFSSPGRTADLAYKAPPPAAPAWPSWAGFYGGLSAGYGRNNDGTTIATPATSGVFGDSPAGITGGLRLGYDWQASAASPLVLGIETDGSLAGFDTSSGNFGVAVSSAQRWWGSTNARVGLSLFGTHWLPYAIGGVAYGGAKESLSVAGLSAGTSVTNTGWDVGGGLEVRLAPHLSVFGEYRYLSLGTTSVPIGGMVATQPVNTGVAWGGFNFRF